MPALPRSCLLSIYSIAPILTIKKKCQKPDWVLLSLMQSNQTLDRYSTSYLTELNFRFELGAFCYLINNIVC